MEFKDALLNLDETVEQRIEKMRARVKELRDKKEEERKRIVEQKLLQKWRNDCDELRTVESKVFEKEVAQGRASQLVEKQMEKLKLEEGKSYNFAKLVCEADIPFFDDIFLWIYLEKRHFNELWEQERLKKVQREEQDQLDRQQRNADMIQMLNEQMEMLRAKAMEEQKLKQEEATLMVWNMFMGFIKKICTYSSNS
jgi:hypothetical protein